MSGSRLDEKLKTAAGWIAEARMLTVSTGAGVSRESGIPTFREASGSGFWEQYSPEQLATVEGFLSDPALVWNWYAWRRKMTRECKPNPGHYAIAGLEGLVPRMTLITQNVDSLHSRAGSRNVLELHGNIARVRCFEYCEVFEQWDDEGYKGPVPPVCGKCGSHLRPDVVWFGENLPERELEASFLAARECSVMLVAGTSGLVQPAASLPWMASRAGAKVIEVNPQPSEVSQVADILLQGPGGEVLPRLVEEVKRATA